MQINKYDPQLGQQIHQFLVENNLENDLNFNKINNPDLVAIQKNWQQLLISLGYPENDILASQALRLTDFYINDRFYGLNYSRFPKITPLINTQNYHEPLIARNIEFISTCEHHLVPINGTATIAYQPKDIIVGLNKLNLILDFFAKRPQLQERLTRQINLTLQHILQTEDIAIIIKAKHNCMSLECVDNTTEHVTLATNGIFKHSTQYTQFFN